MNLYERHLFESNGVRIIKNEFGFAAYKITDQECFLSEIYVVPEKRESGIARALIKSLRTIAHDAQCNVITANIFLAHKNNKETLRAALSVGFDIAATQPGVMILSMEVE